MRRFAVQAYGFKVVPQRQEGVSVPGLGCEFDALLQEARHLPSSKSPHNGQASVYEGV